MAQPDFEQASNYVLRRLRQELAPELYYHNLAHTQEDVVPAVERLALRAGVSDSDLLLLRTAAWFHDLGFVERRRDNEEIGVRIAAAVLPALGYDAQAITVISGMIMATRLPQSPQTALEQLLADADLDLLGREDFLLKNKALRAELAAAGTTYRDHDWYSGQLRFIRDHRYFSAAANDQNGAGKQRNIQLMERLLADSTE